VTGPFSCALTIGSGNPPRMNRPFSQKGRSGETRHEVKTSFSARFRPTTMW
jgi:hypothetical protein